MRVRTRLPRALMTAVAAGAVAIAGMTLGAAPASAAAAISGWGSGPVGVPQTITITGISNGGTQDGVCTDASEPFVATINGVVQQPTLNANVVNGTAQITYAPAVAGAASWTFGSGGIGGCVVAVGSAVSIIPTPTVTVVSAPNTTVTGQSTVINVLVTSAGASNYVPTGSVRLNTAFGVNITSMGLTPSFSGNNLNPQAPPGATRNSSFAFLRWTPPSNGTFTFQAVYGGDANSTGSTSSVDTVLATPNGGTLTISAPNTATVGVPVAISANIFPTTSVGSAGFTLNGAPISASVPFVNGTATFVWTPTAAGTGSLGANYTTNDGRSGSAISQPIAVQAGPITSDSITLVQPGFGPWTPGTTHALANGTSFTFQASTQSGSPVILSDTGPCNLVGLQITIDTGAGQCNIVAKSAGGPGFAPVAYGYTVVMVPGTQTAQLAAPATGATLQQGRTQRLQNAAQGQTNAGQPLRWTVLSNSRGICRLRFPSSGAVNLQLQSRGTCNVRATAPAVPDAWAAYRLDLRYRVR